MRKWGRGGEEEREGTHHGVYVFEGEVSARSLLQKDKNRKKQEVS